MNAKEAERDKESRKKAKDRERDSKTQIGTKRKQRGKRSGRMEWENGMSGEREREFLLDGQDVPC